MELIRGSVYAYDILTYPVYFLAQRPWQKRRQAKRQRAAPVNPSDPNSPWIRLGRPKPCLADNCKTVVELVSKSVDSYRGKRCFGSRDVLMEELFVDKDQKEVVKKTLAEHFNWLTYGQVDKRIDDVMRGLLAAGIAPGDKVGLFMDTRMEWMLIAHALFRIRGVIATIYATLGPAGIEHIIDEVEFTHMVTTSELLLKTVKPILDENKDALPKLQKIIYVDTCPEKKSAEKLAEFSTRITLERFEDMEQAGRSSPPDANKTELPEPDDLALIMYTSGSTGKPKGVMISHKNIMVSIRSFNTITSDVKMIPKDPFVAYLPLAHCMEFIVEHLVFSLGLPIGYSSPVTLIDESPGIKAGCHGDTAVLKPKALLGVPLVLDRVRKGIAEKIESKGSFSKQLFGFAMEYKNYWAEKGFNTPILNKIICKKINKALGGKVEYMFCGGAALSPETHQFAQSCLNVKLMQGFGATETTAVGMIMDQHDNSYGQCGAPLFGAKIRLVDWEDGDFKVTDKPNPRGELVIGGDFVAQGYFKKEEETASAFKEEKGTRWFYTGDIAEIRPDGKIKIIDRSKDLVKLTFGEYISLGHIETVLRSNSYVDEICVVAEPQENFVVALVSPKRSSVEQLAKHLGIEELSYYEMLADPEVQAEVLKSINEHGAKAKLSRVEQPRKIKLCKEAWTPDSGLVTAAMKLRRRQINDFYRADISRMFGKISVDQNRNIPLRMSNGKNKTEKIQTNGKCNGKQSLTTKADMVKTDLNDNTEQTKVRASSMDSSAGSENYVDAKTDLTPAEAGGDVAKTMVEEKNRKNEMEMKERKDKAGSSSSSSSSSDSEGEAEQSTL